MTTAQRPILVVGCPRSGTTLLQLTLHAHPRIAIPPENRFVFPVYRRRQVFGDLTQRRNRNRVASFIIGQPWTRLEHFGVDPADVRRRIRRADPTIGSLLAAVFAAYAARFDKPRWGDKRPAWVGAMPYTISAVAVPAKKTWHDRTHGPIDGAAIRRWPSDLTAWELRLMEAVAAPLLRHHGYVLSAGRRPVPSPGNLGSYAWGRARRHAGAARRRQCDRRLQRRYGRPVAAAPTRW